MFSILKIWTLLLSALNTRPLPIVEDVTSRLANAKLSSVLDLKSVFWQVKLTENSSYFTTLTPPLAVFTAEEVLLEIWH